MSVLQRIEESLVARTGVSADHWRVVLERLEADGGRARMTIPKTEALCSQVESPDALGALFHSVLQLHREDGALVDGYEMVMSYVRETHFTVEAWGRSLALMQGWLEGRGLRVRALDQLQYLACVAESNEVRAGLSLEGALSHFIETYGIQASGE